MKINHRYSFRIKVAAALTLALLHLPALTVTSAARGDQKAAGVWHIAPPEPTISESVRLAELAARREAVRKRAGEKSIVILFSAEPRLYTNDVNYHYRQENNLYYLTGIKQDGVTLVLIPGGTRTREILFLPRRNPQRETWTGHMLSDDEARARSGVQEVWDAAWFNQFVASFAPIATVQKTSAGPAAADDAARDERIRAVQEDLKPLTNAISRNEGELYLLGVGEREPREYPRETAFAARLAPAAPGLKVKSARPIFAELRWRKSAWEQQLIQQAVNITDEAFHRAFAVAAPGVFEYEIQAEFEYTFRRRHADNWGYPCIVGGGANATTLHYETNQERLADGTLLLMDCAAEYDHYSADVTRTIPVSGKFTKEQADIYRIVYEASVEATKRARPGNFMTNMINGKPDPASVHGRAVEVVKEGLLRLGLITSKDNDEYRVWFMHGTSHWLGMNVHDWGGHGPLEPGMIFTVEPGIYIRPDALDVLPKTPQNEKFIAAVRPAFEKYKGIGVRIEDDVLVTDGEPRIMSAAIPSKLEEIEAAMARLRQERARRALP